MSSMIPPKCQRVHLHVKYEDQLSSRAVVFRCAVFVVVQYLLDHDCFVVNLDLLLKEARNPGSLNLIYHHLVGKMVVEDIDPKTGKLKKDSGFKYLGQIYSTNAKVVWDDLAESYSKTDGYVIYNMHYKIHTFTLSGMPLAEYYHKFNSQWRQYDSLIDLPKCTCDTTEKLKNHDQLIRLMQFLMCLDDVFSNVRSNILITEPLPDVKSAFATIYRDESHRINSVHSVVNKTGSSSAFVSKSNNDWSANRSNQSNYNKRFNRGPNPNLVRKHCNMVGHTIDRCFELIGYPAGFNKNSKGNNTKANVNNVTTCGSSNTHMLTSDEYQKLIGLLKSSGPNTACDIRNVTSIPLESNMVLCFASCRLFNLNTNISIYSTYIGWIIDTGASQHMTYSAMFLFNVIDVTHLNITIAHPNGTLSKVNQVGSFKLTNKLVIHDVLVVPGTQLKNPWWGLVGHPADQVLHVLKDKFGIKDLETSPCDMCHKAKQTREPFPISDHKTSFLGQLVHLDVWGPYRVKSREGLKYFLTIVDDFSRAVWVLPFAVLSGKNEVRDKYSKDDSNRSSSEVNAGPSPAFAEGSAKVDAETKVSPVIHPTLTRDKIVHESNVLENNNPSGSITGDEFLEQFGNFDLLFGFDEGSLEDILRSNTTKITYLYTKEHNIQEKKKKSANVRRTYQLCAALILESKELKT
ncbi:putative RNA-directed DNA polymerase [Tanacetum coccineum]